MRTTVHVAAMVMLAILLFPRSYISQSRTAIEGVVLEGITGRPIAGAKVSAISAERTYWVWTNDEGRFAIHVDSAGRYRVITEQEGMVEMRPPRLQAPREAGVWVELAAGEVQSSIQLRMVPEGVIAGQVLGSNGDTFPGVQGKVTLLRRRYDERGRRKLVEAPVVHQGSLGTYGRMDDKGAYRLYGLQAGEYYISASSVGVTHYFPATPDQTAAQPVQVRTGEHVQIPTIVLPLPAKRVPVSLRLVNAQGQPLETILKGSNSFSLSRPNGSVLLQISWLGLANEDTARTVELAPGQYDFVVGLATKDELFYGRATFSVGDAAMEHEVRLIPGLRAMGTVTLRDDAAGNLVNPPGLKCNLYSDERYRQSIDSLDRGCLGGLYSPANYELELTGVPPDAYVESAKAGGEDILSKGLQLSGNMQVEVILRSPGGVLEGVVNTAAGEKLGNAVVALVPDSTLRATGLLYRSIVTDINGKYRLRGIAPGSYQLFAWTELEGAAYRNPDFIKEFEGKGIPVRVEHGSRAR